MLLRCAWRIGAALGCGLLSFAQGEAKEEGSQSLEFRLGFYDHADDGEGNPFLDEELTVIEPVILYDNQVSDDFGFSMKFSYDYVSSASIDRLSKFPEQSGASRDNYYGLDLAFRHGLSGGSEFGWSLGASTEYDYTSLGFGGTYTFTPKDTDAEVSTSLNAYFDSIDIIRFDGTEEGDDDRTSFTGTVDWYQIVNPTTHGHLGVTVAHQSGFLETAYNAVVVEDMMLPPNPNLANNARGFEITEQLPDNRTRFIVFGEVRKRLRAGRAISLESRLYTDTWDVSSLTLHPAWHLNLIPDQLDLSLDYRFYLQTEAKYFDEHFLAIERRRTQDSDLGDYQTHTLGAHLKWNSFDCGLHYAFRSDGLDHLYASVGWKWNL